MLANNYIEAWLLTFHEEAPENTVAHLHLRQSRGCAVVTLGCKAAMPQDPPDLHCLQACTPLLAAPSFWREMLPRQHKRHGSVLSDCCSCACRGHYPVSGP